MNNQSTQAFIKGFKKEAMNIHHQPPPGSAASPHSPPQNSMERQMQGMNQGSAGSTRNMKAAFAGLGMLGLGTAGAAGLAYTNPELFGLEK